MMSEPGPQPAPAPSEPAKKPPPVINLPTVGEGKDQMDVISKLFKNRILLLGSEVGAVPGVAITYPLTAPYGFGDGANAPSHYLDVPWLLVIGVVVGLPVLTSALVGLTARSRLPLAARLE